MIVYLVTNKINGKQYVGQTSHTLEVRWAAHISIRKNPCCTYLYNAIRKYGPENFEIKPLIIVGSKWEMDLYEKGMIKALNTKVPNGYNLTDGGDGAQGFVFTDEQRLKISKGLMGRKMPPKAREKLMERNKGNKFSQGVPMPEAHRLKLIAINKGSKRTPEVLQRMAEAHKGLKHTEETKRKMSKSAKRRYAKLREKKNAPVLSANGGRSLETPPQYQSDTRDHQEDIS